MAFNWGAYNLDEDVRLEQNSLSSAASKRAKAKGTGGSIGGLLGGIIGQILIPIPGVGAAIGAGLGSAAGSMAGGAMSGVSQKDLLGGNYLRNTRGEITTDMAKAQGTAALTSAATAFVSSAMPGGNLNKFGKGWDEGAKCLSGWDAVKGGAKMGAKAVVPDLPSFLGGGSGFEKVAPAVTESATSDGIPGLLGKAKNLLGFGNGAGMDSLTQNILQSGADPGMLARIQQYMSDGWAPDDTIDMDLWKQMQGGQ